MSAAIDSPLEHILVVSTSFPGLSETSRHLGGGAFLLNEVSSLVKAGMTVSVIAPAVKGIPNRESRDGIETLRFEYWLMHHNPGYNHSPQYSKRTILGRLSQIFLGIGTSIAVYRRLKKSDITLVWSNWLQVGFFSQMGLMGNAKHLVTIRGSDARDTADFWMKTFSRVTPNLLNPYPDDPEIKDWIQRYSFSSVNVPGVYKSLTLGERQLGSKNITVIGRFDGEAASYKLKGLGIQLFEVLKELALQYPDFVITVVGKGDELERIRSIVQPIEDRVRFAGFQTNLAPYLEQASFVIGAGGMNGVVMDCAPNKVPVLISKYLTGSMWKNKHNCLVYDPFNKAAFVDTMKYALDNPAEMEEYATHAKNDLQEFALPAEEAGQVWKSRIQRWLRA